RFPLRPPARHSRLAEGAEGLAVLPQVRGDVLRRLPPEGRLPPGGGARVGRLQLRPPPRWSPLVPSTGELAVLSQVRGDVLRRLPPEGRLPPGWRSRVRRLQLRPPARRRRHGGLRLRSPHERPTAWWLRALGGEAERELYFQRPRPRQRV